MNYTYSICHPNQEEIEYVNSVLNKKEVVQIAEEYPWDEKLDVLESLLEDDICFNPSLDFTNKEDQYSFCLTAMRNNKDDLEFSLWFNRKIKYKPFFGLFGEKEKMQVVDKWGFQKKDAIEYLKIFLEKDYKELEALMTI
ncbi:hypothetical protein AAON49_02110 [Pseudotenacibaculum sp. MALMAid0570]|uniref:hypothetical protein n=1 Tax=Pseudotenacibaculum sp. MALMAid0570 TaxID=3143938 RepID=UPI0032DF6AFE